MKKLLIIPLLLFTSNLWATTYHVATDGSGDCTTIADVQALSLVSGDQVLFRYGDTWNQTTSINVTSSGTALNPIYFGAYEDGDGHLIANGKPILNGWGTVTTGTWTDMGGNVWKHSSTYAISGSTRCRLGSSHTWSNT
jgi:hypothetical protein